MNVRGARVVVTGASRGIGAGVAKELGARGAQVVLVARSREALEKVAAEYDGEVFPADLSDPTSIEPLARAIEADGPIDVLVNNAGVDLTGALIDLPVEELEQLFAINLLAPVMMTRAVLPRMLLRGRGHITNVSSLAGTNAVPGVLPYSASKAGLSHFTAGLRAECKGTPITTTLVEIGPVESTMIASLRAHEPTRRALHRLAMLRLTVDLDMGAVVTAIVDAIERERRHVRMPRRNAVFPLLVETPRRMTEFLLAGVR